MLIISNEQIQCLWISSICVFPFSNLIVQTCLGIVIDLAAVDQWCWNGSQFAPEAIWQCPETFLVVKTHGKALLASSWSRAGMLPNVPQCTGQLPPTKNYPDQNVNSCALAQVKKLCCLAALSNRNKMCHK